MMKNSIGFRQFDLGHLNSLLVEIDDDVIQQFIRLARSEQLRNEFVLVYLIQSFAI